MYLVENIVTGVKFESHCQRLRLYSDSALELTETLVRQIAQDGSGFEIEDLVDYRFNASSNLHEILVRWRGFQSPEDSWEPLNHLYSECVLVKQRASKLWSNDPNAQTLLQALSKL